MYARTSSTQAINYKLRGRRSSIITMANPATNVESEFTPHKHVDATPKNQVRAFKNSRGDIIAVKSPCENIERQWFDTDDEFYTEYHPKELAIEEEFNFLKMAYPDEAPYCLNLGPYNYASGTIWSYRLVMPYITGKRLNEVITSITDSKKLLSFLLAIALELERIHQLGIIHGDVRSPNIHAQLNKTQTDFLVHFLDFGSAYTLNELKAVTTNEVTGNAIQWAPERRCPKGTPYPKPSAQQDVYSFGYTLKELLNMNKSFSISNGNFENKFPTLFNSINAMQHNTPDERPKLSEFILQVEEEKKALKG